MPAMFTKSLADDLDRRCALRVCEASKASRSAAARCSSRPAANRCGSRPAAGGAVVQLTDDPPERNCKPSVDFLYRSVAAVYGQKAVAAVLTGMGDDGALGAEKMKQAGAAIYAQDEASCVVYGMPKAVVDAGLADVVAPLARMHDHLIAAAAGRVLA